MLTLLTGGVARCRLLVICDVVPTAHCVPIALRMLATPGSPLIALAFDPIAPSLPLESVVDGLGSRATCGPQGAEWESLRDDLFQRAAAHPNATVVLHSATAFIALFGLSALHRCLGDLAAHPAVRTVVCLLHADAHPTEELAAIIAQADAVLAFQASHEDGPFHGTVLQGCDPTPPSLPGVLYDVCAVTLARRPTRGAPPATTGLAQGSVTPTSGHAVGRLASTTEYFTLRTDGEILTLCPVDWKLAAQARPLPQVTGPTASAATAPLASLAPDILQPKSFGETPFRLDLGEEERAARAAMVMPSMRGPAAPPPRGVIYVDSEEFGDDLDDDLDI